MRGDRRSRPAGTARERSANRAPRAPNLEIGHADTVAPTHRSTRLADGSRRRRADTEREPAAVKTTDRPKPAVKRGRPSSREAILDAAEAVVIEEGAANLTLDAVARKAGASKGGVIYNFRSKDALLEAMVDRLIARSAAAHRRAIERMPDVPQRALRAYVQNSLRPPDTNDRVSSALLAVIANKPELLTRVRDYLRARFQLVCADVPDNRAALISMATEGLWLLELMQLSPLNRRQRAKLAQDLVRLCDARETL
jgi:AcrR family transcriptional regulator